MKLKYTEVDMAIIVIIAFFFGFAFAFGLYEKDKECKQIKRQTTEEICDWIEDNIDNYLFINRDFNESQIKTDSLISDIKKNK